MCVCVCVCGIALAQPLAVWFSQMLIVAILEIICLAINENIGVIDFKVVDMGGSIFVHTFGAYFGLVTLGLKCSW